MSELMSVAPVVYKSIEVNKLTEPLVDLGNLLLVDRDSIDDTVDGEKKAQKLSDEDFLSLARDNVQFLFNKIWELPKKQVDSAICAQLPEGTYRLPREKPVPEKREPTKWEKFAREKGIVSQKKGNRKVWDDTAQDWKPRYGYRRGPGNDNTKDWLIEIPDQKDPYKDYFEERKQEKKERGNKNEVQRLRNIGRSMKSSGGSGSNFVPLGQQLNGPQTPKRASRELTEQMHRAKKCHGFSWKVPGFAERREKAKLGEKRKLSEAKFNAAAEHTVAEQRRNGEINENGEERRKKKSSMRRSNAGLASKYAGKANMHRQQHFNKTKKPGHKSNASKAGKARTRKGA